MAAGASLQAAVDAAPAGAALCLGAGTWKGPLRIDRSLTLWGGPESIVASAGEGTTIDLRGAGARLLGVTVDGSGGRFDTLDAAVHVQAEDAVVEGISIRNAVFGILVEKSRRASIRFNHVVGDREQNLGLRGDSIRLWETYESVVEGNEVSFGRDVVVWYAGNNTIRGNVVRGGRYGSHLMYSHRNVVENNRYIGNVVGIFLMYSRDVRVRGNLVLASSGAAGVGLGLKESGNLEIRDNLLIDNTVGVYLDNSPLQLDDNNLFERNVFRLGEAGVVFHSSQQRNVFRDNDFRDNFDNVRVEGGGDALGVVWDRNHFDDFAGYDLDDDGVGDVPYELRSLSSDLTSQYPNLAFFRGAPALGLVNVAAHVVPLLAPRPILRDPAPRMYGRALPERLDMETSLAH